MKHCTGCGQNLELAAFSRNRAQADGYSNWCKECMRRDHQRRRAAKPEYFKEIGKRKRERLRVAVLAAYSPNDVPECACCGEREPMFLSIDHVNNDGADHRRRVGRGNVYNWLKTNGFPPGFRILCHNCNFARSKYGRCPHGNC